MDEQDYLGNTLLFRMIDSKNPLMVKNLLDAGASVTLRNNFGDTVLHHAIKNGTPKIVEMLLKHLILDKVSQREVLKILLEASAQRNLTDFLTTPLRMFSPSIDHEATNIKAIKLLIERGADVSQVNCCGNGILHLLAAQNKEGSHRELFERLLEKGLDPNAKNIKLATPFLMVLKNCDVETCKLFLKHGARATEMDEEGASAMHYARDQKNVEVLNLLLQNGCGVDSGSQPWSALQLLWDSAAIVPMKNIRFFLENGAKIKFKKVPEYFVSALHRKFNSPAEIARLFLLYGEGQDSQVFRGLRVTWQIEVEHLAMLRVSGRLAKPGTLAEKTSFRDGGSYRDVCLKEIEKMKAHKIDHFTMRDLLLESSERFRCRNYAKSQALHKEINKPDLDKTYPIYKPWLAEKYRMGINYTRLRDNVEKLISEISQPYNLPWLALRKISSHLSLSDMSLIYK